MRCWRCGFATSLPSPSASHQQQAACGVHPVVGLRPDPALRAVDARASVTSSPRWAGRQCRKIASAAAPAISASSTCQRGERLAPVDASGPPGPSSTRCRCRRRRRPRPRRGGRRRSCRVAARRPDPVEVDVGEAVPGGVRQAELDAEQTARRCASERATLLASPTKAIVRSSSRPSDCRIVSRSARVWIGVGVVGQQVDHRHRRRGRESLELGVLEHPGPDRRPVAREQPGQVLGRLAGVDADLGVAQRSRDDRRAGSPPSPSTCGSGRTASRRAA